MEGKGEDEDEGEGEGERTPSYEAEPRLRQTGSNALQENSLKSMGRKNFLFL